MQVFRIVVPRSDHTDLYARSFLGKVNLLVPGLAAMGKAFSLWHVPFDHVKKKKRKRMKVKRK